MQDQNKLPPKKKKRLFTKILIWAVLLGAAYIFFADKLIQPREAITAENCDNLDFPKASNVLLKPDPSFTTCESDQDCTVASAYCEGVVPVNRSSLMCHNRAINVYRRQLSLDCPAIPSTKQYPVCVANKCTLSDTRPEPENPHGFYPY